MRYNCYKSVSIICEIFGIFFMLDAIILADTLPLSGKYFAIFLVGFIFTFVSAIVGGVEEN